jgi:hypothetical protein
MCLVGENLLFAWEILVSSRVGRRPDLHHVLAGSWTVCLLLRGLFGV